MTSISSLLFALIIVFLPLARDLDVGQTSHTRDIFVSLVPAFLGVGLLFLLRSKYVRKVRTIFLLLALLITLAAAVGGYPVDMPAVLMFIGTLGIILLAFYEVKRRGIALIATIVIFLAALHAQWGIAQFVFQQDLNLSPLGETRLFHGGEGIATFTYMDTKLVRSYGSFAHPNIFGGSLALAFGTCLYLLVSRPGLYRIRLPWLAVCFCLLLGIILTFSRVAYLMAALASLMALPLLPKHYKRVSLVAIPLLLLLFWPLLSARLNDPADQAAHERARGYGWAVDIIRAAPVWRGFGVGNYTAGLREYIAARNVDLKPWEVAPVHSVPLLLAAEWGLVLTSALGLLGVLGIKRLWERERPAAFWLLILLPALAFDHYALTQLPAIVLTGVFLVILTEGKSRKQ